MFTAKLIKSEASTTIPGTYNNHIEVSRDNELGLKAALCFYADSNKPLDWKEKTLTQEQMQGIVLESVPSKKNPGRTYWRMKRGL